MRWGALLLIVLAAFGARAQEAPPCPFAGQTPKLAAQLFFGQSMQGRGLISRLAWQRFVADSVTPAFPEGFTVFDASGQWLDRTTRVIGHEPTEVVEVVAADSPEFRARIAALSDLYRRRFEQHTVGIVTSTVCAAF